MVALGDVVEVKGGGTPSKGNAAFWSGDIPWVSPKDMKSWEIEDAEDKITSDAIKGSATNLIPPNSILVVNRSGILKHTLPVGITRRPVAINQDLKALICGPRSDPDYIARIVKAAEPIVLKWVRATTADNFPIDNLRLLEIPFPDINEQRRIAAILNKADALRSRRKRSIELLHSLTQAIFSEMFSDADRWDRRTLGSSVEEFRYGTSNKSANSGFPVLRIPNVVGGSIDLRDLKTVPLERNEFQRLQMRDGDLLLVRTNGNQEYVGRCAVFDEEIEGATSFPMSEYVYASYLIRARLPAADLSPYFAQAYLSSPPGRRALLERAKTSAGQFNINTEQLSSIEIPIPPRALQDEFAKRRKIVRSMMGPYIHAASNTDGFFHSLQHRAFAGEL
jgi:type I restriction enzyme, S subunit